MRNSSFTRPHYEFHIAQERREFYQVDEPLFAQSGNVIFSNFFMVRVFAEKMNRKRDAALYPEHAVKAGQLNAMGLIDEILHYVVELYLEQSSTTAFAEALKWIELKISKQDLQSTLQRFLTLFPPLAVYKGTKSVETYLKGKTAGISNREITLIELLIFHLANDNPAFKPFRELFDDSELSHETAYRDLIDHLELFFETQPTFGPDQQKLTDMLRTPARKFPVSLTDQLEFIRQRWGSILSKYVLRLLSSLDMIKEEEKLSFLGPGPTEVTDFRRLGLEDEPERFSTDLDWMPKVVMLAKSTYVWLDQLSKKYSRNIYRLDQIPDEELDILAQRGFSSLWFIGLWERSSASQKIKQICGNPEAVSSAYSLFDYTIAFDLGGDEALDNLRQRAWQRGIRIASDMVPNHTGIFSKWVIENPDWFVQTTYPVFPAYSYNGPNLSDDERIGIYIEDGYWNRSDAAVQLMRVDHHTGDTRFIFHGNDGTSMPWNDTAQLNYLNPHVREAVIQMIINVARRFPIIRMDAAMTLTKRHFQRLWFPLPGSGGDIPSRAEFAMNREEFDRHFPEEFWREVVDRVAAEVPDTLLLAEAFWMMEGYFVRSLGMHRVYNSAFMNMLKNEENQKYRQAIKSVMDFNPEIMKRYVNFMNNPDEETAVAQFGKDDKYFGVCTLMATLPGLPMFGHGQIEGYAEKYGMEYRRAYWNEHEDEHLISRHEREIFPLLKKRYLFSEVSNFILYDLYNSDGTVNENVFAYSNRSGDERALVLYNNKYDRAIGWIRVSCASAQKENGQFMQFSLRAGLGLTDSPDTYVVFREHISGLEFIRRTSELEINGLYAELDGFKYHVFLDFREISDNEYGHYYQLCELLNGRGVPSISVALKETFLSPVHEPLRRLLEQDIEDLFRKPLVSQVRTFLARFREDYSKFLKELKKYSSSEGDVQTLLEENTIILKRLLKASPLIPKGLRGINVARKLITANKIDTQISYIWLICNRLGNLQDKNYADLITLSWLDELLLTRIISESLHSDYDLNLIQLLIIQSNWIERATENPQAAVEALFQNPEARRFLQINRYQNTLYFNKESFERFLVASYMMNLLRINPDTKIINLWLSCISKISDVAQKAGFRVADIQELLAAS
jgi:glycosidase